MIIGRLNRRVALQAPVRVVGGDAYLTEWVTQETVWAEFMKVRAESIVNFIDGVRLEIAVRYRTDVRKGWRVVETVENNTQTYEVKGIYDIFRDRTVLVCEEVVP